MQSTFAPIDLGKRGLVATTQGLQTIGHNLSNASTEGYSRQRVEMHATEPLYEPQLNRAYADVIAHYGTAVIPARARKPQGKAKVEAGVQLVERWILARLRKFQFTSVQEVNDFLAETTRWAAGKTV